MLSIPPNINIDLMETMLSHKGRIRSPVAAGMFYPEDKCEALDYIHSFCRKNGNKDMARAIIAPHGAWGISGALAGAAFSAAGGRSGEISRVVILGPIHDKREKGLFLSNSHYFLTPLGRIPVDKDISEEFKSSGRFFEINDIPHLGEHSIEILLPFVKYHFPDAAIIPILMGQPDAEVIDDLANALKTVLEPIIDNTLLVVSCNLSSSQDKSKAQFLAEESLRFFYEKNSYELINAVLEGRINACGGALVASLLESGLLDTRTPHFIGKNMVSAVGTEDDTVFYGAVSFD